MCAGAAESCRLQVYVGGGAGCPLSCKTRGRGVRPMPPHGGGTGAGTPEPSRGLWAKPICVTFLSIWVSRTGSEGQGSPAQRAGVRAGDTEVTVGAPREEEDGASSSSRPDFSLRALQSASACPTRLSGLSGPAPAPSSRQHSRLALR